MAEHQAVVRLLRPIRVLVAGHDGFVVDGLCHDLLRLGFQTMATTRPDRVAKLAAIERVNVVVIETSGGVAAAARTASALDELPHRVRLVLVSAAGSGAGQLGYDVIDVEAPAEDLAEAVTRAYHRGEASGAPRASRR